MGSFSLAHWSHGVRLLEPLCDQEQHHQCHLFGSQTTTVFTLTVSKVRLVDDPSAGSGSRHGTKQTIQEQDTGCPPRSEPEPVTQTTTRCIDGITFTNMWRLCIRLQKYVGSTILVTLRILQGSQFRSNHEHMAQDI
ncbi:hypothetical protein BASA62_003022 [Batrachochytrium salamandrivorans]|nr:hypothetical protein BASA62_003022 [Batrachochytrium salamandrivorans]